MGVGLLLVITVSVFFVIKRKADTMTNVKESLKHSNHIILKKGKDPGSKIIKLLASDKIDKDFNEVEENTKNASQNCTAEIAKLDSNEQHNRSSVGNIK